MTDFKPYEVIYKTKTIEVRSYYPVKRTVYVHYAHYFLPLPYMIFARAIYRIDKKKTGAFFYNEYTANEDKTHFHPSLFWLNDGPICLTTTHHYASPQRWDFKKLLEEFWFRSAYSRDIQQFGGSLQAWEKLTIKQVLKAIERKCKSKLRFDRHESLDHFIQRIKIHQKSPSRWHDAG